MGHTWISTDSEDYVQCLNCGGLWNYDEPGSSVMKLSANNGASPSDCRGVQNSCHHYQGECPAEVFGEECKILVDCNCIDCY